MGSSNAEAPVATALDGVAIVGLGGRFPGARNVGEYWDNLAAGKDCITRFSDEQLSAAGYDPQKLRAIPGFVGARGLVEKPEWFDRLFFGVPPKEAEVMDPQQRVFLEVAWEAMEDAGCDPSRFGGLIGVFAGMSNNTYFPFFVRQRRDLLDAVGIVNAVIANEKDFLTTRLAYKFNLRGPALNIQTACSSSLVAVCVACQNLRDHQCDVALAGGVSLTFPQDRGYFYQEGGMTSAAGECRPFDAAADGTIFSSGAGVVVLKRLEDAVAEGDQIYAVIKGHAINNDGAQKVGFAAPSVNGHAEVIALAQAVADISPDTISYLEAHGTATPLGDPVEIAGLSQVFRAVTEEKQFCALGSVKGNIGHCDAASGIASLIKVALAYRHAQLPPSIHGENLNPALHLDDSPFFLNTALRPWPVGAAPRRAGVSSFGVGGTNAHVVLEEAPLKTATPARRSTEVLVVSAKTAGALEARIGELAAHLEAHPEQALSDVAFTLQVGRQIFPHRRAIVARNSAAAAVALRATPKLARVESRLDAPVAFLFSGQGAQYTAMGAQLYRAEPAFREALNACAECLQPELGRDLRELLFSTEASAAEELRQTSITQPAIYAVSYALARFWISLGVRPAAMLGHSVGEFVAATIAGVFSLEDGARLVASRARLVQELPPGAMLAARLTEAEAAEFLADGRLAVAAVNSPKLCVLSGPLDAVDKLETVFDERSIPARRLATSHAFHSPMVEPVVGPFAEVVRTTRLNAPLLPVVSSVSGDWLTEAQAVDPQYWAQHLRATVRFSDAVGKLLAHDGYALLETGPGQTLSQLARQHSAKTAAHEFVHSIAEDTDEEESIAAALGRLWLAGVPLDWPAIHRGDSRRRVSLPTYPFERQRYFADLPAGVPAPLATAATDNEPPLDAEASAVVSQAVSAPSETESAEVAATAVPAPEADMLVTLKGLLSELSGVDLAEAPPSTGLLELGFDSLFLSQTAVSLSRKFGVKISLRQLLKELGTLEALATHIAAGRPKAPVPVLASAPAVIASRPPHASTHGPFRALQRELAVGFTDAQQRWLSDFIVRYTARTAASKRYTQEHRRHFADPRAVAGFKQAWKEMVYPIVAERSSGARLWDLDGNEWIDVILSFGAAMFGHRADFIVEAVSSQMQRGMEIGPTSPLAGEVAARLCRVVGMERAAFCNTGSEAMLGASRIARTVTGRLRIAYFSGSYHGIENEVLGRAGARGPVPIAPGIPQEALANALILDYGDPRALERLAASADEIAAVFVEPVQSRRPGFQPREFLIALRELTAKHGMALVFDEIITGFRCHPGGAQAHFGVRADLALYGKVIGGGLPIGAIAGRAEYLDALDGGAWEYGDDSFPGAAMTFFAGTFVRHPLALAAARAVLTRIEEQGAALLETLSASAARLSDGANAALAGSPFSVDRFASLWLPHASPDFAFPGLLYALLRHRGIHIWENRPCFLSTAHTTEDVDQIVRAFAESAAELEEAGFFSRGAGTPIAAPQSMPTTEPQREVWLLSQQSPEASRACNLDWTLLLDGPLDFAALQSAIQNVVDRHDALRSTFARSGESMIVAPGLSISAPLTDLSSLSPEERDQRFAALRLAAGTRVFDLEHGPVLAVEIVRLEPERHALIFSAHHIACDGWSCDVFLLEISAIYSAQREGRPNQLPPAMPFREYQAWESAQHETPEFAADCDYWIEAYRTLPPSLELPPDRPRQARQSFRGASLQARWPAIIPHGLQRLGAAHGATLFTVLFAGFKTLLARLSGQKDLVVGIPAAGQNLVGGEHLIGHCVNMLPVRSKLDGVTSFAGLLSALQVRVLEAFEHQRVTFGALLQKLAVPRQAGRVPLVSAIFNLDPPLSQMRFADLEHRLEANPRQTFQFDLGVNCDLVGDGLRVIFTYNSDLFDESTIRRWMDFYRAILESAIADSARPLADFSPIANAPVESGESGSAGELEALLRAEPGVNECAVIGAGENQLVAWVETSDLTPVELWPSSPSAGAGFIYDDVLYNAMALDKSRHETYRRAFEQLVKDKVVVDVGTGRDALLARMCLEAGAKKVYAIEILQRPAEQAKALVESLGLAERIVVLHGKSQDVTLAEQADVCVSENVGHIGGAEGCDVILDDARRRFLKPGGIVIPGRCATRIAAISLPEEFRQKPVFETLGAYYARQTWENVGFPHDLRLCLTGTSRKMLASTDDLFEDVDFSQPAIPSYEREIVLTATRDAAIDGFLLWLKLETAPGESLESLDHRDSWLPVFFPVFDPPIPVRAGDEIRARAGGRLMENGINRDYRIAGRILRHGEVVSSFSFDSWHCRREFRQTPFYRRVFRDGVVPVADGTRPSSEAALRARLEEIVRSRNLTARLELRPALPRGSDGVVDRAALGPGDRTAERGGANPFPADCGINQLFEAQAAKNPDALAVEDGPNQVTYAELNRSANRLANHLVSRGVSRGICVGVCFDRSLDFLTCILAVLKAGGAYVPLDPSYPAERISNMLTDAAAPVVLTRAAFAGSFASSPKAEIIDIERLDLSRENASNLDLPTGGEDLAYVIFTSGSTGRPKGVAILHRGISRLVVGSDFVPYASADVVAHASNPAFDASTLEIWGALLNGGALVVIPRDTVLSPRALAGVLREKRITMLCLTAALFHQMAREVPGAFGGVKYLVVAGEALEPEAARLVLRSGSPPKNLINGYGPTEVTVCATCHYVTDVPDGAVSIPIGWAISNTTVHVLNERLEPVLAGESGELCVGGPGLARGYVGAPELTAERFVETAFGRLYRTGDLVRRLPDGTLDFLGRKDQQVKLRGYRIELGEIEAALRRAGSFGECKVLPRAVTPGDRRLIAYVTRNGAPLPADQTLRQELARHLPEYMIPSAFIEVPRFPLTANGKLAVDELPLPAVVDSPDELRRETQNTLHSQLIEIWQETLNHKPVGIRDDFFELGGHSLLAVRMLALVEERLGVRPGLSVLFEKATIEHLAASLLVERQATAAEKPFIALHPNGKQTPFFFLHGDFVGGGFFCRGLAREIGGDRPFYAIHPHGLQGDEPPRSISVMAEDRLRALREIRPHGPYLLGGYCNGALVAFEIARLLEAQGESVPAVIIFMANGSAYRHRIWQRLAGVVSTIAGDERVERDQRFLHWQRQIGFLAASARHYAGSARRLARQPFREQSRRFAGKMRRIINRASSTPIEAPAENPTLEKRFWDLYRDASESYVPRWFDGKLVLLWPREQRILDEEGPAYGWNSVSPDVQLVYVPGDHDTSITRDANLSVVGQEMRRALDAADGSASSLSPVLHQP